MGAAIFFGTPAGAHIRNTQAKRNAESLLAIRAAGTPALPGGGRGKSALLAYPQALLPGTRRWLPALL